RRTHTYAFAAGEVPKEIEGPIGRAESAVADGRQADLFLLLDRALDFLIFDRLELRRSNLATLPLLARGFQDRRPQQAADMIRTERRCCFLRRIPPRFRRARLPPQEGGYTLAPPPPPLP